MEEKYRSLFGLMQKPEPPQGLEGLIFARLEHEMRRASRVKLMVFTPLVFVFMGTIIALFQYLAQEMIQSGVAEHLSILFSDREIVFTFWREFLLYIAGQAPVFELAIFLGVVVALGISMSATFKNIQLLFRRTQLAN